MINTSAHETRNHSVHPPALHQHHIIPVLTTQLVLLVYGMYPNSKTLFFAAVGYIHITVITHTNSNHLLYLYYPLKLNTNMSFHFNISFAYSNTNHSSIISVCCVEYCISMYCIHDYCCCMV
eukprot:841262_1